MRRHAIRRWICLGCVAKMMNTKSMPFDPKRMTYGGFKILVKA